jgi:LysM repeat protein
MPIAKSGVGPRPLAPSPPQQPYPALDDEVRAKFADFMAAVERDLDQGRLADVHLALSRWYGDPRLSEEDRRQITELLDQVAGVVIYSRQQFLGDPHVVKPGETLPSIADAYSVPWQLLANINGIQDPNNLTPGQAIKVVRGPFRAVIDLDDLEMTLMLRELYAGRFRIGVGSDEAQLEGEYQVRDKVLNPPYNGPAGSFSGEDTNNPFGGRKLDLGGRAAIHGASYPQKVGTFGGPGTIRLSPEDVEHVFDILSVGSRVVIQR